MFEVFIRDLELYAYHGVSAEERAIGHRYLVSCMVQVNGSAETSDDVSDTVDYGALAGLLARIVKDEQCHTVERLASLCCDTILDAFELAGHVQVSISKLAPPMPVIVKEAGAVVERKRKP